MKDTIELFNRKKKQKKKSPENIFSSSPKLFFFEKSWNSPGYLSVLNENSLFAVHDDPRRDFDDFLTFCQFPNFVQFIEKK